MTATQAASQTTRRRDPDPRVPPLGGEPERRRPGSGRLLLGDPAHPTPRNHNGGQVQVGPDGKLWLATGDGGGSNNQFGHAQNPTSRLGKLLRLDPARDARGRAARAGPAQPVAVLVHARGRDRDRRRRPGTWEEVNVGLAANYGWPCREGARGLPAQRPGLRRHRASRTRCSRRTTAAGDMFCSIIGGVVVRDPGLPTLRRPLHLRRLLRLAAALGRPRRPGRRRRDRPLGAGAELVRRGRLRPRARRVAERPGVPARGRHGDPVRRPDAHARRRRPTPTPTPTPDADATPTPTPDATPTPTPDSHADADAHADADRDAHADPTRATPTADRRRRPRRPRRPRRRPPTPTPTPTTPTPTADRRRPRRRRRRRRRRRPPRPRRRSRPPRRPPHPRPPRGSSPRRATRVPVPSRCA